MKVQELMQSEPRFCHPGDDLMLVGRVMAEVGCGVLPIVEDDRRVVGVVTDRDVCLALARRDEKPSSVQAWELVPGDLFTCRPADDLAAALATMAEHRVRRLPVVDEAKRLVGILSLDEIVLHARGVASGSFDGPFYGQVAETLQAINAHSVPVGV